MPSAQDYFNQYKSQLPDIQQILALLKRSTAGTFGTAARQRARAFTGSTTSGAFGRGQGEVFAQRASTLARSEAGLRGQERQDLIRLMEMAQIQAERDKQSRLGGFAGIGRGIGTALSLIPGVGTAVNIGGAALTAASGGTPMLRDGGGHGQMPMGGGVTSGEDRTMLFNRIRALVGPDFDLTEIAKLLGFHTSGGMTNTGFIR